MDAPDLTPMRHSSERRAPSALVLLVVLVGGIAVGGVVSRLVGGTPTAERGADAEGEAVADLPPGVVEISAAAQQTGGVQVVSASRQPLPTTLQVTGVVTPIEPRVAHIRPLARGIVEDVSVTLGQRVRQGQPLITIDNVELGERVGEFLVEAAALRQVDAELGVRQRELDRAEALIEIEGIARQELDVRRAAFVSAQAAQASRRAQVARVEEQLHRFGLSEADVAGLRPGQAPVPDGTDPAAEAAGGHRVASYGVLRAPFAGVITAYSVAPGELVDPEDELFTIVDLSEVWVLADVYERDLAVIRTGREVAVTVDAYPGRVFSGQVTYVSDVIDPQTRTANVRCVVDNADGALKLNMFARIVIPTADEREAVVVPVDAVQQIDDQPVVFVQRSTTRFERRDVQTGARAGSVVEIVSGLDSGTDIVSAGSFYLKTALLRERIGEED